MKTKFQGMAVFYRIWTGQLVSLLGTEMTRFALLIWAYQISGSATTLALLGFFGYLPFIILSPFAGVLVDRFNRRAVMLVSDTLSACLTGMLLALYVTGNLHIWHLYLVEGLLGAFDAFQMPAFTAAITTLISPEQYGRVNGLRSLASNGARVFAPLLAGAVLGLLGILAVFIIDLVTFFVSLVTLLSVSIPQPEQSAEGRQASGQFWHELAFGFRYIFRRPGLRALMTVYMLINLFAALTYFSILPAMILARSGGQQMALSAVQSALGIGGVVGAAAISVLGLGKKHARGTMLATAVSFMFGDFLLATGRSLPAWIFAAFIAAFFIPYIVSHAQSIWQLNVPADVQGRVFSTKDMLQTLVMPLGFLAGGLLADHLFEPAMAVGGWLAPSLGWLVGTGPGAGMGLMFVFTATFGSITGWVGLLSPAVRSLDSQSEEISSGQAQVELAGD